MGDGPRIRRTATRRAGGWLAAGIGIASSGDLAAMPAMDARLQLSPLIRIQQSAPAPEPLAGEDQAAPDSFHELHEALAAARERLDELSRAAEAVAASGELQRDLAAAQEQNQQLRAEIDALRAERDELSQREEAGQARVDQLTEAAEQATAAARKIDQELIAVRWQNAQLNTSLAQARAKQDQIETEARARQAALQARIEDLEAGAAIAMAEAVRLRAQLDEKEQQIAAVAGNEAEAARQVSESGDQVRLAEQARADAEQRAGDAQAQLADVKGLLASAERERAAALQRISALEGERDGLRGQLAQLSERLRLIQVANRELETEVDELRQAAATATELARRNLVAVEDRIRELNDAPEGAEQPAGAPLAPEPSRSDLEDAPTTTSAADNGGPSPASVANVRAAVGADAEPVAAEVLSRELLVDGVKSAHATPQAEGVASMLADLPLEQRLHVQGLLAGLDSKIDERGLMTVVPGGLLFAVDGEAVQESAHDTLAKVAELISVYDDRKVLIVGHTDAVGEAAYNKQLSVRRAELVKQFFVDHFEVAEDRLSTHGFGEERPIASEATPEGRRANRRVEVLILN